MADVTISQLSQGTPNKNTAVIPYSDGSTTYKTSPSGIVAASPGSVVNVSSGYDYSYYPSSINVPGATTYKGDTYYAPSESVGVFDTTLFTVNLKNSFNRLILNMVLEGTGISVPSLEPINHGFFAPGFTFNLKRIISNVDYPITEFKVKSLYTLESPRDATRDHQILGNITSQLSFLPNASTVNFKAILGATSITTSLLSQASFQWTAFEVVV